MYKWQKNSDGQFEIIDVDTGHVIAYAMNKFVAALICGSVNAWLYRSRKPYQQ